MLEGLLETIILGYAFSYIAVKTIGWLIDWECRRSNTPQMREAWSQKLLDQGRTEYILALGHEPANTSEAREKQFREMDTESNRKRWRELRNMHLREQRPERTESSHLY
jgi:hypothetical protein